MTYIFTMKMQSKKPKNIKLNSFCRISDSILAFGRACTFYSVLEFSIPIPHGVFNGFI